MIYKNSLLFFLIGLILISIIDSFGAIACRKFNLKTSWINVASFGVYIGIGYLSSTQYGFDTALLINALLGTYDACIGLRLPFIFKINTASGLQEPAKAITFKSVVFMIGVASIFAMLGYAFAKL